MRKWIYESVLSTPDRASVFGTRVHTTGAGEGDDPGEAPDKPFIIIRLGMKNSTQPQTRVKQQRAQVWIHWEPGSMIGIDDFAVALEKHIPTLAPAKPASGEVVMDAVWEDTSGDGYDDHYLTSTRYVTFLVTYNDLP